MPQSLVHRRWRSESSRSGYTRSVRMSTDAVEAYPTSRTTATDPSDLRPVSVTLQLEASHATHPVWLHPCYSRTFCSPRLTSRCRQSASAYPAAVGVSPSLNAGPGLSSINQTERRAANTKPAEKRSYSAKQSDDNTNAAKQSNAKYGTGPGRLPPRPRTGEGPGVRLTRGEGRGRGWRRCCAGSRWCPPRSCSRPSAGTAAAGGLSAAPTCCCC